MRRTSWAGLTMILIVVASHLAPVRANADRSSGDLHVRCAKGRSFLLRIEGEQARVQLDTRQLTLFSRRSSLGRQFQSPLATLIIDEDFVAFVPQDDTGWRDCRIEGEGSKP